MKAHNATHTKSKLFILIAMLAACLFILAACGGNNEASSETSNESTPTEQSEATTEENEEEEVAATDTRDIEHALGTTPITGTPLKIVTLYQGANDAAAALGIEPVGAVESWSQLPMYDYLADSFTNTTFIGGETQPNLEELSKLQPDLIVATVARHEEIYGQLSQIAPTIMTESLSEWRETIEMMGEALNKQDEAQQIFAEWDERVADFKAKMSDQFPIEVTIANFRADHARVYITGFAGSVLKDLGFSRPENQRSDEFALMLSDKESIPEMEAETIFVFMDDHESVQENYKEWTSHPLWENLEAVKNNEVHRVDEIVWNLGGGYLAANLMLDNLYEFYGVEQ
ncbi:ABC transporter substrate-binding protein [Bacillus horti]|uniref:Iron complex transport system substrate-binding protein n=1 Tax=Caldalkalibacillus horti TaxID=77523 RepID=A0ABT9VW44_9BACI|nr:iron-siderophore ABC transporter substrate-binding protein [Bacillus horti]MDQ0165032.1 iron complex transport system substrate-binding protein [Bacillus horti]